MKLYVLKALYSVQYLDFEYGLLDIEQAYRHIAFSSNQDDLLSMGDELTKTAEEGIQYVVDDVSHLFIETDVKS
jgi:hypothetical protein